MEPNIYHSFNAKNLSTNEVVYSFIKNSQFNDLVALNHSFLLGPRGCGKTTLLKMLTPEANKIWNNVSDNDKIDLPFYGVYIPTDRQWKEQLNEMEKSLKDFPELANLISKLIVNINIMKSIVDTFYQLLDLDYREDDLFFENKRNLCIDLIDIFLLDKPISPDLYTISLSLGKRLEEVSFIINTTKLFRKINYESLPKYFFSEFFETASNAFFSFKKNFKKDQSFKDSYFRWALCFDELELAPEWLQDALLKQLRSRADQSILFKLTSTPIVKIEKTIDIEASNLNDYTIIRAWTYDQPGFINWNDFADKLAQVRVKSYFSNKDLTTLEVFGKYNIESVIKSSKFFDIANLQEYDDQTYDANFKKGTLMWNLIKYLAFNDSSFRRFLELKDISIHNPIPKNQAQMGSIFRKMKPIIIYRSQFIRNNKIISRKNVPFYHGKNNIYEICDGNPRFLSGLLDQLLKSTFPENNIGISMEKQSDIIYKTSERYLEIISSHPDAIIERDGRKKNLEILIKQIGNYFYDFMMVKDFTINPIGAFVVDKDVNYKEIQLINIGIKLGAFVYLDPKEAISETGILNKSFRLSYLLHPYFKLPIREYEKRNLSKIIDVYRRKINSNDPTLFSDEL